MLKDFSQPERYLAALHDICRRSWVEVENHHGRTTNIFRQSQRRVQLNRRQVSQPYQRGQIGCLNIMHSAIVAFAPDGHGPYPIGTVLGSVLFVEKLAV